MALRRGGPTSLESLKISEMEVSFPIIPPAFLHICIALELWRPSLSLAEQPVNMFGLCATCLLWEAMSHVKNPRRKLRHDWLFNCTLGTQFVSVMQRGGAVELLPALGCPESRQYRTLPFRNCIREFVLRQTFFSTMVLSRCW